MKFLLVLCLMFLPSFSFAQALGPAKRVATVTIPSSGTTSNAIDIGGLTLKAIITPGTLTGTAIKITASDSLGGTYVPVYVAPGTSELSLTVAPSRLIAVPYDVSGLRYIKIVSGSTEAAARTITLLLQDSRN